MATKMRALFVCFVLCFSTFSWADSPVLAVSARGDNAVLIYNLAAGGLLPQLAKTIPVGKAPAEMCLAANQKRLFVSLTGEKSIAVIDLETKAVVAVLSDPGLQSPDGCTTSPDSKKLYSVDQSGDAIYVFSVDSKQVLKKIAVGKEPRRIIFSPDGKRVLVSNSHSDTLSVIDPSNDTVVNTIKTGNEPRDMAFSPDGKLLAISVINDDSAEFFKGDTLEFKQQVASAWSPQHLSFAPDAQHLYVVGHILDHVAALRVGPLARLEYTIPVAHGPVGTTGLWGYAMSTDGKYLYVSNIPDGTLAVLDPVSSRTLRFVATGKEPYSLVYIKASGGTAGMDTTARADHYRSLATQAMDAVKRSDLANASKLCQTLEQEFDEGELALRRNSPDAWNQVDQAMDDFIHPIMRAGGQQPNADALNKVYQDFLTKLKLLR